MFGFVYATDPVRKSFHGSELNLSSFFPQQKSGGFDDDKSRHIKFYSTLLAFTVNDREFDLNLGQSCDICYVAWNA